MCWCFWNCLYHLLKSSVKPGLLLLEGVLRKGNSSISWKDKRGWEPLLNDSINNRSCEHREAGSGKRDSDICDGQVEVWELLFWSHLGVSCLFFMKDLFLLGHILELSDALEPCQATPKWVTGVQGLGAGCYFQTPCGVCGLTLLSGFMMWSHEPATEVQSAPFLRGFMWDLGFSGMHTSCVFRLKALCWCHQPEFYLWPLLALKHQEKMERVAVPCITDQER